MEDFDPGASGSSLEMRLSEDIGKKIAGRYEITEIIGEGGMGVVYEAWDTQVSRKVAIKLVRSDTTDRKFLSRFRRELEITSKLRHPSTIRVFEHGETRDGRPYMVMELLTGVSLADRLEQGPMDEMEAMQVARQVAESLSEAHEHGVFHRDLKPDNIFIETVGVSKVVKVLDFGIAGGVDATRADPSRRGVRYAPVHVARAMQRAAAGPPHRYLLVGCNPLRDARRQTAVLGRDADGHDAEARSRQGSAPALREP